MNSTNQELEPVHSFGLSDVISANVFQVSHRIEKCECDNVRAIEFTLPGCDIVRVMMVPSCTDFYTDSPVKDAMGLLEKTTGYHILTSSEVNLATSRLGLTRRYRRLDDDYSESPKPIYAGAFGHSYYWKRDVYRWISKQYLCGRCELCGRRSCIGGPCEDALIESRRFRRYHESGHVYILFHAATNIYKVGFSTQYKKRIQSHRASTPGSLELVALIPGSMDLEKSIHDMLKEWLVPNHKEWFYGVGRVVEVVGRFKEYADSLEVSNV